MGVYWAIRENNTAPRGKDSGHPVHHPPGLGQLAGQQQVPDKHPAFEGISFKPDRAPLAVHLQDRGLGRLGIVQSGGIAASALRREVLEVGQVDIHLPLQGPRRKRHRIRRSSTLLAVRWGQAGTAHGQDVGEVGGGDQVQACRTLSG